MKPSGSWRFPVGTKTRIGFRWHGDDLPVGVTITSGTKAVTPAVGLTVADPSVNSGADGVYCLIEALAAGDYYILIVGSRSDGDKNVELAFVEIFATS